MGIDLVPYGTDPEAAIEDSFDDINDVIADDEALLSVEDSIDVDESVVLYENHADATSLSNDAAEVTFSRKELNLNKPSRIKRVEAYESLIFLFLELMDLELDFLNTVVINMREYVLNSNDAITYFLYSAYSVYGKVPLLPEFHLTAMRTILPYVLRNFLTPIE